MEKRVKERKKYFGNLTSKCEIDGFNLHKEQCTKIGLEDSIDIFFLKQMIKQILTMMSPQGTERRKDVE